MYKKIVLILSLSLIFAFAAKAYLAQWLIPPTQDTIDEKLYDKIIVSDSVGWTILWDKDGKQLFKTQDKIMPFKNGYATVIKEKEGLLVGFLDESGNYTSLPEGSEIAYNHPYFYDGYLVSKEGNIFRYYDTSGQSKWLPGGVRSYPFLNGFAPGFTYGQFKKEKDPYYNYNKVDGKGISHILLSKGEAKEFDFKDINFLSRVGAFGKGIAVIKNKLYWFDPRKELFEPIKLGTEDSEKKQQPVLDGDYSSYFLDLPEDSVIINAKYGKKQTVSFLFDGMLTPIKMVTEEEVRNFVEEEPAPPVHKSSLAPYGSLDSWGLMADNVKAFPEQFEEIGLRFDNKAFAKYNGKWGLIEVVPGDYTLTINKGEVIPFRHRKYESQIKIDLPAEISSKGVLLDIEDKGLELHKTTFDYKDTQFGNVATFDCTLTIPNELPDTATLISYSPVSLSINGIKYFDPELKMKAFYYKYYNVDVDNSETTIENGVANFIIKIDKDTKLGDADYQLDLRVEGDSINVESQKISETRHKCTVYNLKEGVNSLNIIVGEKGCPQGTFPFEIAYTKPVPKKKQKEEVVVRKKQPVERKEPKTGVIKMEL